jgi:hypothetical protein
MKLHTQGLSHRCAELLLTDSHLVQPKKPKSELKISKGKRKGKDVRFLLGSDRLTPSPFRIIPATPDFTQDTSRHCTRHPFCLVHLSLQQSQINPIHAKATLLLTSHGHHNRLYTHHAVRTTTTTATSINRIVNLFSTSKQHPWAQVFLLWVENHPHVAPRP